jgi:preprotein translocase SecE subunit
VAHTSATPGVRGGILLTVAILFATLFLASALWVNHGTTLAGQIFTGVLLALGAFGIFRVLVSATGQDWCKGLEFQGFASLGSHKKSQGQTIRRYTLIGFLIIGISGAWALYNAQSLPAGTLNVPLPFANTPVALFPAAAVTVPMLLVLATIWFSWRAINMPTFGDFLISTENEMNKVSWSSRKSLIQDTIVVLITVVMLSLFLLLIDLFWGWLLSLDFISVLPPRDGAAQQNTNADGTMKLTW